MKASSSLEIRVVRFGNCKKTINRKVATYHGSSKPNEGLDNLLSSGALVFLVEVPLGPPSERVKSLDGEAELEEGGGVGSPPGMFIVDPKVVEAGAVEAGTLFESVELEAGALFAKAGAVEAGMSFELVGASAVDGSIQFEFVEAGALFESVELEAGALFAKAGAVEAGMSFELVGASAVDSSIQFEFVEAGALFESVELEAGTLFAKASAVEAGMSFELVGASAVDGSIQFEFVEAGALFESVELEAGALFAKAGAVEPGTQLIDPEAAGADLPAIANPAAAFSSLEPETI
ncbi:hypothetical protein JOM56_015102 [Amanita muscaria]